MHDLKEIAAAIISGPNIPPPNPPAPGSKRAIAIQSILIRLRADGIPLVHRSNEGKRFTIRIDHGGDPTSVSVAVATLVAHAARHYLFVLAEAIGELEWEIDLQSVSFQSDADRFWVQYQQFARQLGLKFNDHTSHEN